jgi:hypothetical protein
MRVMLPLILLTIIFPIAATAAFLIYFDGIVFATLAYLAAVGLGILALKQLFSDEEVADVAKSIYGIKNDEEDSEKNIGKRKKVTHQKDKRSNKDTAIQGGVDIDIDFDFD